MNKDKINSKIKDLEAEIEQLKKLANEPEKRTPEAGDVWSWGAEQWEYVIGSDLYGTRLHNGKRTYNMFEDCDLFDGRATYLGKFNEVYVKISDVRDALQYQRVFGIDAMPRVNYDSLRKLNIIKD